MDDFILFFSYSCFQFFSQYQSIRGVGMQGKINQVFHLSLQQNFYEVKTCMQTTMQKMSNLLSIKPHLFSQASLANRKQKRSQLSKMQEHGVHRTSRKISGIPHSFQFFSICVFSLVIKWSILCSAAKTTDYTLPYPYYSLKADTYFQSSLPSCIQHIT